MGIWNAWMAQLGQFPFAALLLVLFLSAAVQQVFPPYPAELLILSAACLPRPAVPMLSAYGLGAVLTSTGMFLLARRKGGVIFRLPAVRRLFPRIWQLRTRVLLRHYGAGALLICKFIPGMGSVSLLVAGAMGLDGLWATLAAGAGSLGPCFLYFFAGRFAGTHIEDIGKIAGRFGWSACLFAAGLTGLAFLLTAHRDLVKKVK